MNGKLAGAAALWISAAAKAVVQEQSSETNTPPLLVTVTFIPVAADVATTGQRLLNADSDQDNWLLYGRTYDNQRFSPLTQINKDNVKRLSIKAMIHTGVINSFEATPIVVDGIMY